jgi:pyridoxine 4-dehydrogenase
MASGGTLATLPLRTLGSCVALQVSRMGYGAWPLSYDDRPPEAAALAVLHRALDLGVRFIDTSDAYCKDEREKHHNEHLIRKAIDSYPDQSVATQVVVATKGICIREQIATQ